MIDMLIIFIFVLSLFAVLYPLHLLWNAPIFDAINEEYAEDKICELSTLSDMRDQYPRFVDLRKGDKISDHNSNVYEFVSVDEDFNIILYKHEHEKKRPDYYKDVSDVDKSDHPERLLRVDHEEFFNSNLWENGSAKARSILKTNIERINKATLHPPSHYVGSDHLLSYARLGDGITQMNFKYEKTAFVFIGLIEKNGDIRQVWFERPDFGYQNITSKFVIDWENHIKNDSNKRVFELCERAIDNMRTYLQSVRDAMNGVLSPLHLVLIGSWKAILADADEIPDGYETKLRERKQYLDGKELLKYVENEKPANQYELEIFQNEMKSFSLDIENEDQENSQITRNTAYNPTFGSLSQSKTKNQPKTT